MVLITKENKTYNYPINLQPTDPSEYTLEVYSHMSKTTTTFTGLTGVVVDDFVGIEMTDVMLSKLPNGEYDYTVYDNDQTRVSIGLLRVDLEQQGEEDDPEYVVYHDEMDGYLTTKDMSEYEEEIAELEEEIVIKDAIISGLQEQIDSVTATTINFNGVFTPAEGTLGWNSVDVQVKDYCYFKSLENNNVLGMDINDPSLHIDMEYSINKGEWVNWDFTDITLQSGDTVYLRGNNPSGTCSEENYNFKARFTTSGKFDLGGNFVSLFDKTVTATACPNYEYCFNRLFQYCNIVHINKYFLSQLTTLSPKCYSGMFEDCRFMENTPELPATALTEGCYASMFRGCKMLTTIPDLPATTLAKRCYSYMFYYCDCLVDLNNVTLPATTLAEYCYETMFGGCRNLQKAPYLPATTLVNSCYRQMFLDCYSINYIRCNAITITNHSTIFWLRNYPANGTFVKNINATGLTVESGTTIDGIPSGWTILNDYTELQSTAITTNGTYVPQSGSAFDNVVVNVPTGITPTGQIAISGNGTYDVTQYASASVHVPTGITPTGQIAISGNGTYDVTQYASANVHIPLNTTGITSNGTYIHQNGGWNQVTVNVPSVTTQSLTQQQYDALTTKDPMVIYLITE